MAGIAGAVLKPNSKIVLSGSTLCQNMKKALQYSDSQTSNTYANERCACINVLPISQKENSNFVFNKDINAVCAIDGYIYIKESIKNNLLAEFNLPGIKNDIELLPFLIRKYSNHVGLYLAGCYNLFAYDIKNRTTIICNDKLGFYPMYTYETNDYIVFGSKIECILASGLMNTITFDIASIAEHLLFNYPITDYTLIKDICTLANATVLAIDGKGLTKTSYWTINSLFQQPVLSHKDSFDAINLALSKAVNRMLRECRGQILFSLTGGWDSRLVLSYLLPDYKDKLKCYSFGSKDSCDITIPIIISKAEMLDYYPVILDENYLEKNFLDKAKLTIKLSNGIRSYKRAHYLYAIEQLSKESTILLTGIFGDEILKVGKPQGNIVLSSNTINLVTSGFKYESIQACFSQDRFPVLSDSSSEDLNVELINRVKELQAIYLDFSSISEKLSAFRFMVMLRKFFGSEASSYNDFVYCSSPFIDIDTIEVYLGSEFSCHRCSVDSQNVFIRKRSSDLYTSLVKDNYPKLIDYNSSRGYSMADTQNNFGKIKILFNRYMRSTRFEHDSFKTASADSLFYSMLIKNNVVIPRILEQIDKSSLCYMYDSALSLVYWMDYIKQAYL